MAEPRARLSRRSQPDLAPAPPTPADAPCAPVGAPAGSSTYTSARVGAASCTFISRKRFQQGEIDRLLCIGIQPEVRLRHEVDELELQCRIAISQEMTAVEAGIGLDFNYLAHLARYCGQQVGGACRS